MLIIQEERPRGSIPLSCQKREKKEREKGQKDASASRGFRVFIERM
jgi:hypothetical protein